MEVITFTRAAVKCPNCKETRTLHKHFTRKGEVFFCSDCKLDIYVYGPYAFVKAWGKNSKNSLEKRGGE